MKASFFSLLALSFPFFSCQQKTNEKKVETWKNEIIETELAFCKMAEEEGMDKAFLAFVAPDGAMLRGDQLIKGIDSITTYMEGKTSKGLSWKPDFVDVSTSGDLGYTYGKYTYTFTDSLGTVKTSTGIFHTVWKRQSDGSWKFVWD